MKKKPLQVLLVEDNPGDARLYQEFLRESGLVQFELEHVKLLKTGLEHLAHAKPDAIILDLGLPDSQGLETLTKVQVQAPEVPIIVLTGLDDAEKAIEAVKAGAQDYLVKGEVDGAMLVRSLRYAIERKQAEGVLRESDSRYHLIFENSGTANTIFDKDCRVMLQNSMSQKLTLPMDARGRTALEIFGPEQGPIVTERMQRVLTSGVPEVFETKFTMPGGTKWIRSSYFPLYKEEHELVGIQVISQDITEKKQMEETLRESEERYRMLFEKAPVGIAISTYEGKIIDLNTAQAKMIGRTVKELRGKGVNEYYLDNDRRIEMIDILKSSGKVRDFEMRLRKSDGSIITELLNMDKVQIGAIDYIFATGRDITERKRAEEALLESEERYRSLIENATIGIYRTTPEGQITTANPALVRMLGFQSFEELAQRDLSKEGYEPSYPRQDFQKRIEQEGKILGSESAWKRKDGSTIFVRESARLVRDENDRPLFYEGTVEDITERKLMEDKLDEERNLLRTLINNLPDRVYAMDVKGRKTLSNVADWQASGGKKMEDIIGKTDLETYPPELAKQYWALDKKVIDSGEPIINREEPGLDSRGNPAWVLSSKVPLRDGQGKVVGLVGIGRDITERKQVEEKLSASESELRALFAAMTDVVIVYGADGRYLRIAPTNPINLYRPQDDMLGRTVYEVLPKEQADFFIAKIREAIRTNQVVLSEYALQINGKDRWFASSVSRLSENTAIWVAHDITERKQTQILQEAVYRIAAAADTTGSLDELYAQIHQIISSVMPAENFFITLYDEAQDLLRFPYFKDAADAPFMAGVQPGKGLTAYVLRTGKSLLGTQAVHDELERQGEVILLGVPCAIWLGVPLIVEGKTIGAMVVQHYSDPKAYGEREQHMLEFVSTQVAIAINRKRADEEIHKLNAELEQRVEDRTRELREAQEQLVRKEKLAVLGQLAGGVGHELRNPLSVINTSIYYLKLVQPEADEKIKQHHAMIEHEVHNADKIIGDLLDFARVVSAEKEPVSVPELVQKVLDRFPAPASVKVTLDLPADLPQVLADGRQMEQVLGNLVVNACQAMASQGSATGVASQKGTGPLPLKADSATGVVAHTGSLSQSSTTGGPEGGKLTISARQKKKMVEIAVKDTGVGIAPENMKKLFEPLFTTKAKGIGLGLAVSKKLAEANGGRIEVESEVGKGSTFTLYLCAYDG